MTALLEARNVSKVFGGGGLRRRAETLALDDFSFRIDEDPPAITAVVGESGSGKTTLARLLLGLIGPTSGEVLYRGQDIQRLSADERRRFLRDVQVIFQDPYEVYNPFYKVDHVLETPIRKFHLASSRAQARQLMEETLNAVGLRPDETLGRHPHQLSGGQRQRVMVARALLVQPRLIIADEPVSMVDASLRATILESLRQLHLRFGISLLYITHDLTTAYQISQNILVMYRGEVAEAGAVDPVVKQPQHPYTQLLIQSIPQADPDHPWIGHELRTNGAAAAPTGAHYCRFVERCPYAMDVCREQKPPLFQTDERRAVACFLYQDSPQLAGSHLERVMATAAPSGV
jgi:oligopeptide/dipeptide ABC transporter ATP-binding protein